MKPVFKKGLMVSLFLFVLLVQFGCSEPREKRAVYVLVDTSGTYSEQFDKVQSVLRYLLGALQPGESLALARIDSESFNEKDIVARMSFDLRPSMANAQKRAFIESINKFEEDLTASKYTDITGGILQAIEYLNETRATQRTILIFSDLKEEIKKGQIRNFPISFNGIRVVAINVTKLKSDNVDPRKYQARIDDWAQRVEQGGGEWQVINEMNNLSRIVE